MEQEQPQEEHHQQPPLQQQDDENEEQRDCYYKKPTDPNHVYPLSSFPPMDFFVEESVHHALIVPAKRTAELKKRLRGLLLQRPRTKDVYDVRPDELPAAAAVADGATDRDKQARLYRKLVLQKRLNESNNNNNNQKDDNVIQELLSSGGGCHPSSFRIQTGYEDWGVERVLRRLLPVKEIPTAFETVGTIAHVNLRDELLPYQYVVGKVLLDKNQPRIRTVVHKTGQIDTVYRTFGMKIIAGHDQEGWSRVSVKEEGCTFDLDFTQVYWNSRLAGEHQRLVQLILRNKYNSGGGDAPEELVVADIMAGVGPFAVPLTAPQRKGQRQQKHKEQQPRVTVHANDLNPTSHRYLVLNGQQNKCRGLRCYNTDGRAFVHRLQDDGVDFHHAIMNLPASAPEFLDAFRGFCNKTLPTIHVHCFAPKDETAQRQAKQRCEQALGCPIPFFYPIHTVRNVAPTKNMLCVSFPLPEAARSLTPITVNNTAAAAAAAAAESQDKDDHDDTHLGQPEQKKHKTN